MKYTNVSNVKDYEKLSFSERHFLGFWYRLPMYYEINNEETFEEYWKTNYPIQFFVRNTTDNILITLEVWKDKIIDNTWRRLFPRNAWARKTIPHTYSDKTELIKNFLFASIIDFVENENIDMTDWESNEKMSDARKRITLCYDFVKNQLPKQEQQIEKLLHETYGGLELKDILNRPHDKEQELRKLEEKLEEDIQYYLTEIVQLRNYLWT